MKKALLIFSMIGMILASPVYSQTSYVINEKLLSNKEDRSLFDKAELLIQGNYFLDALPLYENLLAKYPDDGFINFRLGMCYLYRSDLPEKSLDYFRKAEELKFSVPDFNFFYG